MFPDQALQWPRGCWPDQTQTLLLRACLLEDDASCLRAWEEWRRLAPLDFVDGSSLKLLVVLHGRLSRISRSLPDMRRLTGIARYYWVRTQISHRVTVGLLQAMGRAGLDSMLLKGAALNATVYGGRGRAMSDIDLAVRRSDIDASLELLDGHGWRPRFRRHQDMRHVSHATHLVNGNGQDLDLHWDVFHDRFLADEQMEAIWEASRVIEVGGLATRILCPADQLLHICAHGARYDAAPPFRWLADACLVVRTLGADLDWARCARLARQHGLVLPVRQTLSYLERHLDLELPGDAALLERERVSLKGRFAQRLAARRPFGVHPFVQTLPANVFAYARLRRGRRGIGLGKFLCLVNDLEMSPAAALGYFARLSVVAAVTRWKNALRAAMERMKGRQLHVMTMASAGPDELEGAYPAECHRARAYRWTYPRTTIRLTLQPADYAVELNLVPARAWQWESLKVVLNRSVVTCGEAGTGAIRFRLSKDMFVDHREQRLVLQCEPWDAARNDPRQLGLPLVDARFLRSA
jgi:hypothetical protein